MTVNQTLKSLFFKIQFSTLPYYLCLVFQNFSGLFASSSSTGSTAAILFGLIA